MADLAAERGALANLGSPAAVGWSLSRVSALRRRYTLVSHLDLLEGG